MTAPPTSHRPFIRLMGYTVGFSNGKQRVSVEAMALAQRPAEGPLARTAKADDDMASHANREFALLEQATGAMDHELKNSIRTQAPSP